MDQRIKTYEGMFLMDSGNPDFNVASEPVKAVLTRYGAEILSMKPWDDRKLMYEIKGRKRGLYILTFFKMDTSKLVEVEHDCQLNERILRMLVLRRDTITEQEINAETPATGGVRTEGIGEEREERPETPAVPVIEGVNADEIADIPAVDDLKV